MAPQQRSSKGPSASVSNGSKITDPRFEALQNSSLYRNPSSRKRQTVVDKRFGSMLTDHNFSSKAKVDRYGRKLRVTKDGEPGKKNPELAKRYRLEDQIDSDNEVEAELERVASKFGNKDYDPARDGGFEESSSEEEESEEEADVQEELEEEDDIAAVNTEAIPDGEVSRRLAVVNLDWDHIRAVDLMAVFSSYASGGGSSGRVESVTIYPSEFGKERMEREETEGPPKELFASKKRLADGSGSQDEDDSDLENGSEEDDEIDGDESEGEDEDEDERIRKSLIQEDNGEEVSSSKLRNYQLERLRYYYAVVACTSSIVAKEIYDNVDGREYLTSANFFDLRFIPDEMDFSEDKPRDECSKVPSGYKPNDFVTAALQHSKVKLTWDAEDTQRKDLQAKAFSGSRKDLDENELRAYLASDDSEEEDDDEEDGVVEIVDSTTAAIAAPPSELQTTAPSKLSKAELKRQLMRAKLGLGDEPAPADNRVVPVGSMQVTFTPGLSAAEQNASVFENQPEIDETTAERYVRKERERKARRKEKLKAKRTEANGDTEASPDVTDQQDQGFDDPFFTATPAQAEALKEQKIAEKKKSKRTKREADEKANATDSAEVEKILGVNTEEEETAHFSMNALEKAGKALKKQKMKKGKSRLSQSQKAALEAKANDTFEMDVADKRFGAVHDRPEFALDPSHPKFRKTEGMNILLEEARQRRKRKPEIDDEDGGVPVGKKGRR